MKKFVFQHPKRVPANNTKNEKLKGDGWKGGQTYYEIQVASDSILLAQDKADLWNTGKLKSDVSVMVPYRGKTLTSRSL